MHTLPQTELVTDILVNAEDCVPDAPARLTNGIQAFVEWALRKARLLPGEFPIEALCIAAAHRWAAETEAAAASAFLAEAVRHPALAMQVELCLQAAGRGGAPGAVPSQPRLAGGSRGGGRRRDAARLAHRFRALEAAQPLADRLGRWAAAFQMLRPLSADALAAEAARIVAANTCFAARIGPDPAAPAAETVALLGAIARDLCTSAGLRLVDMVGVVAGAMGEAGPGRPPIRFSAGLLTSGGLRFLEVSQACVFLLDAARQPTGHAAPWPGQDRIDPEPEADPVPADADPIRVAAATGLSVTAAIRGATAVRSATPAGAAPGAGMAELGAGLRTGPGDDSGVPLSVNGAPRRLVVRAANSCGWAVTSVRNRPHTNGRDG